MQMEFERNKSISASLLPAKTYSPFWTLFLLPATLLYLVPLMKNTRVSSEWHHFGLAQLISFGITTQEGKNFWGICPRLVLGGFSSLGLDWQCLQSPVCMSITSPRVSAVTLDISVIVIKLWSGCNIQVSNLKVVGMSYPKSTITSK